MKYLSKFSEVEVINESLPRQKSVDQLERVMKLSSKTDIGNRISDMSKEGANIVYIRNPIENGLESYEDFEKKNKKFIPSWNLKHLMSPFNESFEYDKDSRGNTDHTETEKIATEILPRLEKMRSDGESVTVRVLDNMLDKLNIHKGKFDSVMHHVVDKGFDLDMEEDLGADEDESYLDIKIK
jgi:hypothetical protein